MEGALEDDFQGCLDLGVFGGGDGAGELVAFEGKEFFFERVKECGVP